MLDAVRYFSNLAGKRSEILREIELVQHDYLLATIHRAETVENSVRLNNIIDSLRKIPENSPVVLPLHPRTKNYIKHRILIVGKLQ